MQILLDIDGVMLPANAWRVPEILSDGFSAFSPRATAALNKLLDETNAGILLTTSHKSRFSAREWQSIFSLRGIAASSISALPEAAVRASRLDEIVMWYEKRVDDAPFVIIDDDKGLYALPTFLKSRLVLANGSVGLTQELADSAIRLLNEASSVLAR